MEEIGSRQESATSALRIFQTDQTLKNEVDVGKTLRTQQQQDDDDYWGRDLGSKNASERNMLVYGNHQQEKNNKTQKPNGNINNQGGGFISGMYEQSLKNFSELVPPIETSKLEFD